MDAPHSQRWRRAAAIVALAFMLGPFAMSVTGCFTLATMIATSDNGSDRRMVPAGEAIHLDRGQVLALHLRNGTTVRGRYIGRTLLEAETYARRFLGHATAGGWSPLTLGESLSVELTDGRELHAPFAGYAMRSLVLRLHPDSAGVRIPLLGVSAIRGTRAPAVSLEALIGADLRGELPSAEALAMEETVAQQGISGYTTLRREVPLEEVQMATASVRESKAAGLIVFGLMADIALFLILRESLKGSSGPSCEISGPLPTFLSEVRVTDRPFDRTLGRFVGEDVAWGDPFPAIPDGLEAAAAAVAYPSAASPGSDDQVAQRR